MSKHGCKNCWSPATVLSSFCAAEPRRGLYEFWAFPLTRQDLARRHIRRIWACEGGPIWAFLKQTRENRKVDIFLSLYSHRPHLHSQTVRKNWQQRCNHSLPPSDRAKLAEPAHIHHEKHNETNKLDGHDQPEQKNPLPDWPFPAAHLMPALF